MVPIIMGSLPDSTDVIALGERIVIERMSPSIQRARAPRMNDDRVLNPYHRAAATHAVVIRDVKLSNRWVRWPKPPVDDLDLTPVNTAVEALMTLTGDSQVGYSDILLRPKGWAVDWVTDLPPIIELATVERVPREAWAVWNDQRVEYSSEVVGALPGAFHRLSSAPAKIHLAARRARRATLRNDSEDSFLDAIIGVEALLGRERDEITYRLALRAATVLSHTRDPSTISRLVKFLYGQRSAIVHGVRKFNETTEYDGSQYSTYAMGPWLLRELLNDWLLAPEPWTPQSLDEELIKRMTTE